MGINSKLTSALKVWFLAAWFLFLLMWAHPLKADKFQLLVLKRFHFLLFEFIAESPGAAAAERRSRPRVDGSNKRSPGDTSGERRSLWQDSLFCPELLCTNRCPHRQEGRCPSRGSREGMPQGQTTTAKINSKTASTLLRVIFQIILQPNHISTSCLLGCFQAISSSSRCPHSLKRQQKVLWSSRRHTCWAFIAPWQLCSPVILEMKTQPMPVTSLLLGGMHPCLPPLCNSTWHFYYAWNRYNLLSQLGSFI